MASIMFAGFAFGFFILSNMAHLIRQKEFICKETIVCKKNRPKIRSDGFQKACQKFYFLRL